MERAEIGVWTFCVDAREALRDKPPAPMTAPVARLDPAPGAGLAAGYGGGAVAVESGRGKGSGVREVMPAAIGTVDGGCACVTASR